MVNRFKARVETEDQLAEEKSIRRVENRSGE